MNILSDVHQRGLSMVELLVALAISSFLILGITQVYIDNKRSYVFQQSQAGNSENSRFAVLMINELLGKAGYRRLPDQDMADAFPRSTDLSTHCEAFPEASVITKIKTSSNQVGFCLRYQPAYHGELRCDGNSAELDEKKPFHKPKQDETLYVAVKFTPDDSEQNRGTLSCITKGITKETAAELIDGVADMTVEFGSGPAGDKRLSEGSPFKDAASWSANDGVVRAVRYSLLMASRPNQRDSDSNVFTQWLKTTSNAEPLEALDKKQIYQVAVGAQALRNVMP